MKTLAFTVIGLLVAGLYACTATEGQSKASFYKTFADTTGQNGRACFYPEDVRGYGTLDHDVMSISTNDNKKYYLATFMPGCNSLQTSPRALFSGRSGEVCGGGMDKIRTGGDTCSIRQIFEFKDQKEAFAAFDKVKQKYESQ